MANSFTNRPENTRILSPQALWELLVRLQPQDHGTPSFRSLMNASHFQLSEYFLDTKKYREFFRPAISAARQDFQRLLPTLEDILGIGLAIETLEEYPEEDLPDVVASLEVMAVKKIAVDQETYQSMSKEVEELRARVKEHDDHERKRLAYVAQQRRRDRRRRERRN